MNGFGLLAGALGEAWQCGGDCVGGTRRSRYQTAAASASEVRVGLRGAMGWGYFHEADACNAMAKLDRLLGALWRLTH